MRSHEQVVGLLDLLSREIAGLQRGKKQILAAPNLNAGDRTDRADRIARDIERKERERLQVLEDLVAYPPYYRQYETPLQQFVSDAPVEKSVFVMTKYPDGQDAGRDSQLQRVIDAVTDAVRQCGFEPRLANAKKYHPNLWENVEVYLLGCSRGIAIVENKFKPQLNPNVAMEWGWMRARVKPVLYLVEKEMDVTPADVNGLIQDRFAWDNPAPDIRQAIFRELKASSPAAAGV